MVQASGNRTAGAPARRSPMAFLVAVIALGSALTPLSDGVHIRRARFSDARDEDAFRRAVARQERRYWPGWENKRQLSVRWDTWADVAILIAVHDSQPDEVIGTAEVIGPLGPSPPLPKRCLLRDVWVDPQYRRQGIASRLIHAAEALVAEILAGDGGQRWLSLEVEGDNTAALHLYQKAGFVEAGGNRLVRSLPGWMRGTVLLVKACV